MLLVAVLLVAIVGTQAAPASQILLTPASTFPARQLLIYNPSLLQPSLVRLESQQINDAKKLEGLRQDFVYLYPATSLLNPITTTSSIYTGTPIQLIQIREDEGGQQQQQQQQQWEQWISGFQNWWQQQQQQQQQQGGGGASNEMRIITKEEAEKMMKQPDAANKLKRYYIISGQPQFFGSIGAFNNPLAPIFSLQPLTTIARSKDSEIQSEQVIDQTAELLPLRSSLVSVETPIQPIAAFQPATDSVALPVHQDIQQPIIGRQQGRSLDAEEPLKEEPKPEPQPEPLPETLPETLPDEETKLAEPLEEKKEEKPDGDKVSDDPSVAQAAPAAIALTGKGGLASARPIATAVAGDGGMAISAPKATSLAGDFSEDEDEDKKTKA